MLTDFFQILHTFGPYTLPFQKVEWCRKARPNFTFLTPCKT